MQYTSQHENQYAMLRGFITLWDAKENKFAELGFQSQGDAIVSVNVIKPDVHLFDIMDNKKGHC